MNIIINTKYAIKTVIKEVINVTLKIFMKVTGYKSINIIYGSFERIGHLAAETELFLRNNLINRDKRLNFLFSEDCDHHLKNFVANKQLMIMIKRKIKVVENRFETNIVSFLNRNIKVMKVLSNYEPNLLSDYEVWDKCSPQLSFTIGEEKKGKELLRDMNIGLDAKFICFHSRDKAYLDEKFKDIKDWSYHNYRDCSINNYLMSAEYFASKGIYAIRMGETIKDKLVINNSKIIDYASHYRSDFGDIYLPTKCKFFLGNTAGIYLVSVIFNIPAALANWVPLGHPPLSARDIFIPKKLWLAKDKRFLTFREIIEMGAHMWLYTQNYLDKGIEVIENTPEEILELAKEMDAKIDGEWVETDEYIELQAKYRQLFPPGAPCYGFKSKIGSKFLKDNRNLLE